MTASDHLQPQQFFYHGTNADLKPGDYLSPRGANDYGRAEGASHRSYVYATYALEQAWTYARSRVSAADGQLHEGHVGNVYQVQPTGKVTSDPDGYTDASVRTKARFKVIGKVSD